MTVRLAISVEGPTEREFCKELLAPHLQTFGIFVESKIVVTKRNIAGTHSKGGSISFQRVIREIRPLLHSFDYITTLYDFYGFRDRVAGETVEVLNQRLAIALGNPLNFIPNIQQYEFEALLFAAPDTVGRYMNCSPVAQAMHQILNECGEPEQINDSPTSAPSKRIENIFNEFLHIKYIKPFHGPLLMLEIGLTNIRTVCHRFNEWLIRLESLGRADN